MKRTHIALFALLGVALCATVSSAQANPGSTGIGKQVVVDGGEYLDITVEELRELSADRDVALVNVHIPFEGDLPNTDASIPFNEIGEHAAHLLPDKDAEIVLYCRSGRMSTEAAAELVRLGYTRVRNLVGGFNAWSAAGLPMAGQ